MVEYIKSQKAKKSREERALKNGVTFTYSDTANGRCYYIKFKSPELIEEADAGLLNDDEMISLAKLLVQWTKGIFTKLERKKK